MTAFSSRPRIAVIGANGQVGAEVSLFLHVRDDVDVVPIARSAYSTSLLRRAGLDCRHGTFASPDATHLIADCNVVADFSWPRGTPDQIRQFIRTNTANAVRMSPAHSQYVFISTQSVYRLTTTEPLYRIYGRTKRQAESLVLRLGKRLHRPVYVLRLGQVHGLLQSVSHDLMATMRSGPTHIPAIDSFTVFAFTVAEALAHTALGLEAPGTYTLVSVPPWTWREVHTYYANRLNVTPELIEVPVRDAWLPLPRIQPGLLLSPLWHIVQRYRDLLNDLVYRVKPEIAERARTTYLKRRARHEVAQSIPPPWRPYLQDKSLPGRRLVSLSDSRVRMHEPTTQVEALLASLT
ncbi:MAG: hypothetical protein DMD91_16795 [Candidatus Rokuibacteriota bacterium]|nr:MAG: hypothetical protein DMD91_16795 [Candidatus Rokubacteria bacterium]